MSVITLPEIPQSLRGSVRSRAVNGSLSRVVNPLMAAGRPSASPTLISALRPGVNRALSALSPVVPGTQTSIVNEYFGSGQVRGEWVRAGRPSTGMVRRATEPIIYYLHGSGYVICSARTHRGLVSRLSRHTGLDAFTLEYRLGPEYRWPAGGDDAIRGYRWLLAQGYAAHQIIVAGDSAGGHLALDLIAENHRAGLPQPAGMVLFSPLYDPSFELAIEQQLSGVRDPMIDAPTAQRILRFYTGRADPGHERMIVNLRAEHDLPPTLIQVGGLEVMGGDAQAIHDMLIAAGGHSQLHRWPDQSHVFQMFPGLSSESRDAVRDAARFMTSLHDDSPEPAPLF